MMENATKKMLSEIYISARSGCEAINTLIPKVRDPLLLGKTASQLENYADYAARADKMMQEKNLGDAEFPMKNKWIVRGGVLMETAGTKTQDELARAIRIGARDGANRMRSLLADMSGRGCDADVLALGQRMMTYEIAETELYGTIQLNG